MYRLGQLRRAAFEDACRDEVGIGGAVFVESSKHSHVLLHSRAGDRRLELKAMDTLVVTITLRSNRRSRRGTWWRRTGSRIFHAHRRPGATTPDSSQSSTYSDTTIGGVRTVHGLTLRVGLNCRLN